MVAFWDYLKRKVGRLKETLSDIFTDTTDTVLTTRLPKHPTKYIWVDQGLDPWASSDHVFGCPFLSHMVPSDHVKMFNSKEQLLEALERKEKCDLAILTYHSFKDGSNHHEVIQRYRRLNPNFSCLLMAAGQNLEFNEPYIKVVGEHTFHFGDYNKTDQEVLIHFDIWATRGDKSVGKETPLSDAVDELLSIYYTTNRGYEDFFRSLLLEVGFPEDSVIQWIEENADSVNLAPNRFSMKRGYTGLGVIINKEWALKFDKAHRIWKEWSFYIKEMGKFSDFVPGIMDKGISFTNDGLYGALILENVFNQERGSQKAFRKFGFRAQNFVDYIIFMTGVMHKEMMPVFHEGYVPETEFKDILGRFHHKYADDPLKNLGIYNLHFFRDTAPSPESQKMIDYYNAWRRENSKCIIHGDIKPENIVNGHFVDPSQWGKGNELDDLAFFLSDIRIYRGKDFFSHMVDKYIYYRRKHDKQFDAEISAGMRKYLFDNMIRLGALQQQLALRDSVMKKRRIELHRRERNFYYSNLEDITRSMIYTK